MILHCPYCHASFPLEALIQDQAGRELMALLATKGSPSLLSYLTLFRTPSRSLAWDRSLKLCKEVLELELDPARLEVALVESVEALRSKRDQGTVKPLKNHNYLKAVLRGMPANTIKAPATISERGGEPPTRSKTASAIGALESYKRS
jgi:hypothetical protein